MKLTITIERITNADAIFLLGSKAIIEYSFSSVDNTGDTTGAGTAVWKVGNTIVATNTAAQGNNSFDITEYLNVGANTIRLTITDSFGTLATKTWTVTIVEFKLESTFDDTLLYTNTDVVFRYLLIWVIILFLRLWIFVIVQILQDLLTCLHVKILLIFMLMELL